MSWEIREDEYNSQKSRVLLSSTACAFFFLPSTKPSSRRWRLTERGFRVLEEGEQWSRECRFSHVPNTFYLLAVLTRGKLVTHNEVDVLRCGTVSKSPLSVCTWECQVSLPLVTATLIISHLDTSKHSLMSRYVNACDKSFQIFSHISLSLLCTTNTVPHLLLSIVHKNIHFKCLGIVSILLRCILVNKTLYMVMWCSCDSHVMLVWSCDSHVMLV